MQRQRRHQNSKISLFLKFKNDMLELLNQEFKTLTMCVQKARIYIDFQPDIIKIFLSNKHLPLDMAKKEIEFLFFFCCEHFFDKTIISCRKTQRVVIWFEAADFKRFARNLAKKGPYDENLIVLGRDDFQTIVLKVLKVGQLKFTMCSPIKMTNKELMRKDLSFLFMAYFKSPYILKMFRYVNRIGSDLYINFYFGQSDFSQQEEENPELYIELENDDDRFVQIQTKIGCDNIIEINDEFKEHNPKLRVKLLNEQVRTMYNILELNKGEGLLLGILNTTELVFKQYTTKSSNLTGIQVLSETIYFLHTEFHEIQSKDETS